LFGQRFRIWWLIQKTSLQDTNNRVGFLSQWIEMKKPELSPGLFIKLN